MFTRWAESGAWQTVFNTLAADADTEWLMIDSTIVRAHRRPAGGEGGGKDGPSPAPAADSARRRTPSRTPGGAPRASS
jgi:transposase